MHSLSWVDLVTQRSRHPLFCDSAPSTLVLQGQGVPGGEGGSHGSVSLFSMLPAVAWTSQWRQLRAKAVGKSRGSWNTLKHVLPLSWSFPPISHPPSPFLIRMGSDFPSDSAVKSLPAIQETQVWSLGQEDPLEEGVDRGLQSVGSQRVRHDRNDWARRLGWVKERPQRGWRQPAVDLGLAISQDYKEPEGKGQ